jgi:hypothetical protein
VKTILIGYPGSQCIVKASKFLTDKYLPSYFDIYYKNYEGPIEEWAEYVKSLLRGAPDDKVIFSLDDYLIADHIDIAKYHAAEHELTGDVVCVKLCQSTEQEHRDYPVTTQYCIWDREYLFNLLGKVRTPWEFEIKGSRIFDKQVLLRPCLNYHTNSSISARWQGINFEGLKPDDIKILTTRGYI